MALFYYQALERNGRKTKGMIEADSQKSCDAPALG